MSVSNNADIASMATEIENYAINSKEELEAFRIAFLGTKNKLKDLFSLMGKVATEDRKEFGQMLNGLKTSAETKFAQFSESLENAGFGESKSNIDLSMPGFHPARDMTDTYYLANDFTRMLRSQTSTVQVHVMESQKPPIRIISPGRVYRNETISSRSHCQFHQVEGLYIDKNVSLADMKQTLDYYAKAMYGPHAKTRLRASYFPFTEPSAEMDVYWGLETEDDKRITKGTGWLEVLGCGMVDPAVLENCGIDPEVYSGFAWGMGIERQAMLKYKVTDIRHFFENDVRFLSQF